VSKDLVITDEKEIGEIEKNSLTSIKICTSSVNGSPRVDIREYYTDKESGEKRPSKKGINIPLTRLSNLIGILSKIEVK